MTFDLLLSKSQQVFLAAPQMVYKKWIVAICEAAREDEGKKKNLKLHTGGYESGIPDIRKSRLNVKSSFDYVMIYSVYIICRITFISPKMSL